MDSLTAMRLFADVVQSGSFSQTARHFGLSASSVNRAVDRLEQEAGARLIDRTTRRHSLTEAGHLYVQHINRVLADVDATREALAGLATEPRGVLHVSAPVTFGRLCIAPLMHDFLTRHPAIEVELSLTDRLVDLVDEAVDVAVRIGELDDSSLVARQLLPMDRIVCASPHYLERVGRPTQPEHLSRMACLAFHRQATIGREHPPSKIWTFEKDGQTWHIPVTGNFRSNSGDALVAAALQHHGLVLVPQWLVKDELARGLLVPVLADFDVAPDGINNAVHLVYPSRRLLPQKVRVLVDFLVERTSRREIA
jgi:DNA-binding transcriptional LysR family regulator